MDGSLEQRQAAKRRKFLESGRAICDYPDETLDEIEEQMLSSMYAGMPGAWTGLALTLAGEHGENETIQTLKVIIRQNWVLMIQNEKKLRLLRRLVDEGLRETKSSSSEPNTMVRMSSKLCGGSFVAIGDELVFRGTMLMKGGSIVSKLSEEQRDTVIKAFKEGGSKVVVEDVVGDEIRLSVVK